MMGAEWSNSLDAQKRSTGLVAVRSVAKMGVVVAHFMVVGRWCSSSESVEQSPKQRSVTSHQQDGWTKFSVYRTGADYFAHVHFTCLKRTSVILWQVVITYLCILDSDFYDLYSFKTKTTKTCIFYQAKNR